MMLTTLAAAADASTDLLLRRGRGVGAAAATTSVGVGVSVHPWTVAVVLLKGGPRVILGEEEGQRHDPPANAAAERLALAWGRRGRGGGN